MKTRWKVLLALAAILLALLVYFAATAYRTLRATQTSQSEPASPAPAALPSDGAAQAGRGSGAFLPGEDGRDFSQGVRASIPRLGGLGESAAAEYRRRARLPKSTAPIEDNADPIRNERTPSPARSSGPEPSLTAYPAEVSYEAPDRVAILAFFSRGQQRVPGRLLTARLLHETRGEVAVLELNDHGLEGDETAGDLLYTATFAPPPAGAREFAGSYVVSVRGLTEERQERAVSTGFLYSAPDARPTGRFRDRLADGSLLLEVEIEVFRAGRFHVEGSLFTLQGEGVAWAQNAARFQPGRTWFPLTFYGLAIREKGLDGPYILRSLALSTVSGMPNQKNRVLTDAYETAPYRASQFTEQPYNDPGMIEAAERLEQAARP